ncbi:MAG: hypothetical protein R2825_26820 [Saprospiraceae bacterium]
MTIQQSITKIKTEGLQAALEALATEQPDAMFHLKRMESLREVLQAGNIPGEEAFVQSNRIGYAICQVIENSDCAKAGALAENETGGEIFKVVSLALRQYLNITEDEHEAIKSERENRMAMDGAGRKHAMEEMLRHHEATTEDEWSPFVPNDKLPLDKIGELLAGKQLAQALRHLLAHCQGTDLMPESERMKDEIKQLVKNKSLGIVSEEFHLIQQNRIAIRGKELLQKLVDREVSNKNKN